MTCGLRPYEVNGGTIPALVVSSARSVNNKTGAVSMCAHEYLRTLVAAGFRLQILTFDVDRRPLVRLRRKLWPQSYANMIPPYVAAEAAEAARQTGARFIFLHMTDTAPLAGPLRGLLGPDIQIAMLSHGTESVDYLHKLRNREEVTAVFEPPPLRRTELARQLCLETSQRQFIDHVFCLAPFEAEIERWLGAKAVTWLPRTIPMRPVVWNPQPGRVGFVGGLDHQPNLEGLLRFARALDGTAPDELRLRVIGGPEKVGRTFAQQFRHIEYLGPLSDEELEADAATWNCFVNPMFCYPRGCSTKLAVGLGWQIPVLTTPAGCRGYVWRAGQLPIADTAEGMARLAIGMLNRETAAAARREIQRVVETSPTLEEVAAKVHGALLADEMQATGHRQNKRS
jgi:glycosyltransferase involved in cell wall biosynthesis